MTRAAHPTSDRCRSCGGEGIGGAWGVEECDRCGGSGWEPGTKRFAEAMADRSGGCRCSDRECPCPGDKVVRF